MGTNATLFQAVPKICNLDNMMNYRDLNKQKSSLQCNNFALCLNIIEGFAKSKQGPFFANSNSCVKLEDFSGSQSQHTKKMKQVLIPWFHQDRMWQAPKWQLSLYLKTAILLQLKGKQKTSFEISYPNIMDNTGTLIALKGVFIFIKIFLSVCTC